MENFKNNEPTKEEIREQAINNMLGAKAALSSLLQLDLALDRDLKELIEEVKEKAEAILKE